MLVTGHEEKNAGYYDSIYHRGYDTSGYRPLYEIVMGILRQIPSPRVLELGCGIGDLGRMIVEEGFAYRGFDFSPEAIRQCRRIGPAENFTVGDIYGADVYQPVNYNTIIALEVLEHVDDLRVMDMIPPGVRFIASVPDYDDAAHLRLYRDIRRDIVDRFRPYLHMVDVATASADNASSGMRQSIHIFSAIRILS
jgi:2-polyprenyl-3-methyl-5-hydroxy-6-metoxy-1,4-benzoquinol methylase